MGELSDGTIEDCARYAPMITARESLSADEEDRLETHLGTCVDCAARARTIAPSTAGPLATIPAMNASAYVLGREVARGGMGRILAAADVRIGRKVALKELIKKSPTLAARFAREARVTARLQHPGIVPIYEIGQWADGTPFYTMRMVEGRTLRAEIAERPTLEARVALLPAIIAAADAVAFAHGQRVIHRDLTPNNVLVGAHGETVVIDWGLAKDLAADGEDAAEPEELRGIELTSAGTVMGTLAYMPPEQARGEPVDERADVFALGCMLAHVLSGAPPAPTLDDLAADRVAVHALELPGAPRDLVSIVRKATSPVPADRYASAGELADELRRFQTGRVVEAHAYSGGERVLRWIRAHRGALLATLALLVGGSIAGGVGLAGVLRARDRAEASALAAERASTSYLTELGRQKLLAGESQQAAVFLSAAYSAGDTSTELRFMLGSAMRAVEATKHVLIGSPEPIRAIHVSPDKTRALVVHQTIAEQWSIADGTKLASLAAPNMQLMDATYGGDGKTIVSWGDDAVTRIWAAESGRVLHVLPAGPIDGAALSSDGATAITVGKDTRTRTWDARAGTPRGEPRAIGYFGTAMPTHLVLTAPAGELRLLGWDGSLVELPRAIAVDESADHAQLVTCSETATTLWSAGGKQRRTWENRHPQPLVGCGFDDLGSEVVVADKTGGVITYAVSDGALVSEIALGNPSQQHYAVRGRLIVEIPDRDAVEVHDAQAGTLLGRFPMDKGSHVALVATDRPLLVIPHLDGSATIVDSSPSRLLGEDRPTSSMWDFNSTQIADLHGDVVSVRDLATGHGLELRVPGGAAPTMAFAKLAPRILVASGSTAITYDTISGRELGRITTQKPLMQINMSNDGTWIAVRPIDGMTEVWSTDGKTRRAIVPPTAMPPNIASTKDETDPIRACGDAVFGNHFFRLCTPGRTELVDFDGASPVVIDEGGYLGAATSLDDTLIAIIDARHVLRVFELATGAKRMELAHVDTAAVYFAPSNELISTGGPTTEIRRFPSGEHVARVAVPDGSVIGNGDLVLNQAGVWSVRDGRELLRFGVIAHDPNAFTSQWSPADGSTAMLYMYGHHLDLWDLRLEQRAPTSIAAIVSRQVPWQLDHGTLAPASRPANDSPASARAQVLVRDRGLPVVGALVQVVDGRPVATDANGIAYLEGLVAGPLSIAATSPGAGARNRNVYVRPGNNQLAIDLEVHGTLSGRVALASGVPVGGLSIVATPIRCSTRQTRTTTTSATGEFELTGLPGGCTLTVVVTAQDAPVALVPVAPVSIATDDARISGLRIVAEPIIPSDEHHRVELVARPPGDATRLAGAPQGVRSKMLFKNLRADPVRLYITYNDGTRALINELQSGATLPYNGRLQAPWLVTDLNDHPIAAFVPTALWTSATIR